MKNYILIAILLLSSFSFSQCFNSSSAFENNKFFLNYNKSVDKIIVNETKKMNKLFMVDVEFRYGVELGGFGNAEFINQCKNQFCTKEWCDGTITFGTYCLNECLSKKYGDEIVVAILAHEYAHAIQAKFNMDNYNAKYPELHADYLAGYYIGQRGLIEKSLLETFCTEFFNRGDYGFYQPDHHGTPQERKCAFLEGYKMAIDYKFNIYQAYNCGIDYISQLYPCQANIIINQYSKEKIERKTFKNIQTGNYYIESVKETIYIKNYYGELISVVTPNKPLKFNNLKEGVYMFYPCKKTWIGRVKKLEPFFFEIVSGKTSGITLKKIGMFWVKTFTIHYPY